MGQKAAGPADALSVAVHGRIRAAMGRRGIKQQALAEQSGVSKTRLSKTVFNSHAPMTTNELFAVCSVLGVSASVVLADAEMDLVEAGESHL